MKNDKKKLLLVEDQAMLAVAETHLLKKNGYDVVIAKTGENAVETVKRDETIDLILMDIDLGDGIDGTEAAKQILSFRTLPIVFLTSHIEEEMVERVRNITRYGYVVKDSGEFVLLSSITMAIELFEAHRAAAEKEIRFQNIFEHSLDGIAVFKVVDDGRDFLFLDINGRGEAIENIEKENIVGRSVTEVFPGITEMGLLDIFRQVFRTGKAAEHTDAYYEDERIKGWRSSYVYLLPGKELVSVFRDMTPEQELKQELQTTKNIIEEGSTAAFSWKNTDGWPVLSVSHNVKHLFGYEREAFLRGSITYEQIIHPEDRDRVRREVQDRFAEADIHTFHHTPYRIVTKSGAVRWVEDRTILTRDDEGRVVRIDGLIIDTTERKQAEDRLKRSSSELECLHAISKLVENKTISLDRIQSETVKLIPRYLCRNESMSVRLTVQGKTYLSEKFSESGSSIREPYVIDGEEAGVWEMFCNHPSGHCCSSYLVAQEKKFLSLISERLGKIAERYQAINQNRTILQSIGAAIILLDKELRIKTVNPAAERLFDIRQEKVFDTALADILNARLKEKAALVLQEVREAAEQNTTYLTLSPVELEADDGAYLIYQPHFSKIPGGAGDIGGAVLSFQNITLEFMQRRKLKEKEEQLKRINEFAHIGIWEWKIDTDTVTWSDELYRISGREIGTTPPSYEVHGELYAEESWERLQKAVAHAIDTGKEYSLELQMLRPDGSTRWVDAIGGVICDAEGRVIGLQGIVHDVDERKRAEIELREQQELYKVILEASPDAIIRTDLEGTITFCNRQLLSLLHAESKSDIIGINSFELIVPEQRKEAAQNMEKTLRDGHLASTDYSIKRMDGSSFESRLSVAVITGPDTAPAGFIGILRDVTEDKLLISNLKENEERFRSIAEQANDGIVMTDESGNITVWNKAYEAITGTNAEEVMGKPLWEVQPQFAPPEKRNPAVIKAYKEMLTAFFRTGTAPWLDTIEETEIELSDGTRKIIESKIFCISTVKGYRACSIIRDVTGRKETEHELKKLLSEKEILLKDVQHRIKNDVNMLYSFIMIQARNQKSVDAKYALEEAAKRIAALSGIYENLYRRKGFNTMDTQPLIKSVVTNFLKTSMLSDISITIDEVSDFDLPSRTGVALGVIINELLTNAVKHAFSKEMDNKRIELSLMPKGSEDLALIIQDNGKGLPRSVREGNEKGFGLSITEALVKQYEGTIQCSNKSGARFEIRMKLA